MFTFVVIIHALNCVLLVIVILMQAGRGGGLTENFSSAESVFGAQTSAVMIRITSVLGTLFILTSLMLTFLSLHKEKSLMESRPEIIEKTLPQVNREISKAVEEETKVKIDDERDNALNSIPAAVNSMQ